MGSLTLYDLGQITFVERAGDSIRLKGEIGNEPFDSWLSLGQSVNVNSITVHIG